MPPPPIITMALVNRITSGDGETWTDHLVSACDDWDVNTERRVAMFLAQTAHESAGYRRTLENMRYSAKGLRRTWPQRYSEVQATRMAYDEFAIAEHSYGGRNGNGPEGSGDGFRFRGRGLIQITGRSGYLSMSEHLGADFIAEPELLELPLWAAYSATAYWDVNKCSEAADADDFERVTRIINGGTNGMEDRLNWLGVVEEAMR